MNLNIKKFTIHILIILSLILISNCSDKNQTISISNIDSTLIGKTITESDLGIKYNPPKMWISASKKLQNSPDRKIRYGAAVYSPINIYFDAGNKAVLSLGEIVPNDADKKFDLENYIHQLTKRIDKDNITRDSFNNNGVEFIRMKIIFGVWFTYRIIFKNKQGKYVQFDYSLQRKYKKDELPAIVSSVGSIRLI